MHKWHTQNVYIRLVKLYEPYYSLSVWKWKNKNLNKKCPILSTGKSGQTKGMQLLRCPGLLSIYTYTLFICKPCTIHAHYIPYSSHNSHSNKLHRLLIHTTTSAYKLNRLSSPVKLQPSTTQLILHVALHTQCYLLHSLPHARIPFCAHKWETQGHGWLNGTRCRNGVSVLSCNVL